MLSVSGRTLSGFWILCLTAFLFSMKASAATYVVAKQNCSDTAAGTAAQPWCTIGHAAAKMVPGDTVTIGPGSYNESVSPKSGTAAAFITYQGQPGAVLNGTGLNAQAFNIDNVAYLNISGFEVTQYLQPRPAGNSVDIYGTSHDIHFSKMLVHDNWNGIIMSDSANNIYISSSTVYNSRYGVGFENTVHDVFIDSVTSHDNSELYIGPVNDPSYPNGDGFSDDAGTSNLTIRNSIAYNNGDGGFDIRAVNFSCTNCAAYGNGHIGFRIWDSGGPYTLINALSYGNHWFPLQVQNQGPATFLYNCTFVNTAGDHGYAIDAAGSNFTIRNTIFSGYTNGLADSTLTNINDDYDLYDGNGSIGFTLGSHSLKKPALFADPLPNSPYQFQSNPLSPAIDAGTTLAQVPTDLLGTLRPQGKAYDMGAYELLSGTPPPPPPGNACDLNADSAVNVGDVQICVNQVLGVVPCTNADLQGNGTCTAIDVQRVVNSALGQTCVVGP